METSKEDTGSFHQSDGGKLKEEFVKMLQIIMSSKTKEEQQKEAFNRLRSCPELLLLLLQDMFNIGDKDPLPSDKATEPNSTPPSETKSVTTEDVMTTTKSETQKENIQRSEYPKSPTEGFKRDLIKRCETTDESLTSYGDGIYPKRIRKSKYADIMGDLSHIRKEPRYSKDKRAEGQLRNKHRKKGENSKTPKSHASRDNSLPVDNDVLLVRKFMDILMHPKSQNHQESVLAVLRSDPKMMKLFLKEKANLGKQSIPVFRRTHCTGDQVPREDPEISHTGEKDSIMEEATSSRSDAGSGNSTSEDANSLLGFLLSATKANKQPLIQLEDVDDLETASDQSRIDSDRPAIHFLNNLESDQSLTHPFLLRGIPPDAICPSVSAGNSIRTKEHHYFVLDGIPEGGQLASDSECSLHSPSPGGDMSTFDISLHEHFQSLSRDLFHVNNSAL